MALIDIKLSAKLVGAEETSLLLFDLYSAMDLHSQYMYVLKDAKDVKMSRCYIFGADAHILLFLYRLSLFIED
jgi:hypothetical protein